jgi:hypothetical protein
MRVLIVLLALVATPFVAGVSQGRGHNEAKCNKRAAQHPGKEINKCDGPTNTPPPPPPATACAATVTPGGTASISGAVSPAQSGWCLELSGPGFTTTAPTDASGSYAFTGLPAGTYTLCEVVPSGWTQTSPPIPAPCASGFGYQFDLLAGESALFVNFGNTLL